MTSKLIAIGVFGILFFLVLGPVGLGIVGVTVGVLISKEMI